MPLLEKLLNAVNMQDHEDIAIPAAAGVGGALVTAATDKPVNALIAKMMAHANKNDPIPLNAAKNVVRKELPGTAFKSAPGSSAFTIPGERAIYHDKAEHKGSTILHEAGHLHDRGVRTPDRLYGASKRLYPLAAISAAGFGGYDAAEGQANISPYAALATALIGAPHLSEEVRATSNARHLAKAHGLSKPRGLTRALMTYAGKPSMLAGALTAAGLGYGANKLNDN